MKAQPFLITSLPHSRTAWLAAFMSSGDSFCRYETVSELTRIEDLPKFFDDDEHKYVGVSDCALAWFLPWIMKNIAPRTVIVERPVDEVNAALKKMGMDLSGTNYCPLQMARLQEFHHHPQVLWVHYADLDKTSTMASVVQHLTPDSRFDEKRYEMLREMHIEVDVDATVEKVRQRKANMDAMLREILPLIKPLGRAA